MKVCIIIPVFNEQNFIKKSVESLINQTIKPAEVIYVNDNSTDNSKSIINNLIGKYEWIRVIDHKSVQKHIPGSKVIEAFNFGLKNLETQFDVICKFDGDIVLPTNYIEKIIEIFDKKEKVGITGGNLYILRNGKWIYENIAAKTHVRGPIKAYRAECFNDIKGLKSSIGWDTVDVLLAQKKGWLIYTDKNLIVKHLKPTGQKYSLKSKILQGESLYKMRFGFILSVLSLLKSSFNNCSIFRLFFGFVGYFISFLKQKPFIVTEEEGVYIRNFRWRVIYEKYLKF